MIGRQEILDFAADFGLDPQVVEKDYMLGWLLAGIGQHAEIGSEWLFKGGTCLKKCYFETLSLLRRFGLHGSQSGSPQRRVSCAGVQPDCRVDLHGVGY